MKKLLRYAAVAVMGLALSTGVAGAASSSIDTTGPDSTNKVEFKNRHYTRVTNNNDLSATNNNPQSAYTGDADVKKNTTGGDATTGNAKNDSLLSVDANVDNSGSLCDCLGGNGSGHDDEGTIENTGPDSYNSIKFNNESTVKVTNNNHIAVTNNNSQKASTGDASVYKNTTGGNATSGDAENISTTELSLTVTN